VASPDPKDALQDEIRKVLNENVVRGDRLIETIALLGPRHGADPFRAALSLVLPMEFNGAEARDTLACIERHRVEIEALLGRDPGFAVAAFDLLYEKERTLRDPVFRDERASPGPRARPPDLLEDVLRRETRRSERSGRSLAVVVLSPDHPMATGTAEAGLAALCDSARDVDSVAVAKSGDYVVVLPCTGGREGLRAADRLRRALLASTGMAFSAGVAAASGRTTDAHVLTSFAREALRDARGSGSGTALHRLERRAHSRILLGTAVPARLRNAGEESEIVVEDLSLGGALLSTPHRVTPGGDVILALRGPYALPAGFLLPSRVLRAQDGPTPGRAPFRAAVGFSPDARLRVAALLAGLRARDRAEER
jgi:PilZ domain-containing protein